MTKLFKYYKGGGAGNPFPPNSLEPLFWVKVGEDRQTLVVHFSDAEKAIEIAELEMTSTTGEPFSFSCKGIEEETITFELCSPINFDLLFKGCKTHKNRLNIFSQPWKRRGKNTKV